MKAAEKIKSPHDLIEIRGGLRARGKTLVFTNGCFDLLHLGHLKYLEAARDFGDYLVVAVNSDRSVRRIKGPGRPIVPELERGELVAGLHCVDAVVLFDASDPLDLIRRLVPEVLVKGADWPLEQIVGADFVLAAGGRVERIELTPGRSSSALIERIRSRVVDRSAQA